MKNFKSCSALVILLLWVLGVVLQCNETKASPPNLRSISEFASYSRQFPTYSCLEGYQYNVESKNCILEDVKSFELRCPAECTADLQGTCNCYEEAEYVYQCPTGYKLVTEDAESSLAQISGSSDRNNSAASSLSQTLELLQEKPSNAKRSCVKMRQKPATIHCPEGSIVKEGLCVAMHIVPAERKCKGNGIPSGDACIVLEEKQSDSVCLAPYKMRQRVIYWEPVNVTAEVSLAAPRPAAIASFQQAKRKGYSEISKDFSVSTSSKTNVIDANLPQITEFESEESGTHMREIVEPFSKSILKDAMNFKNQETLSKYASTLSRGRSSGISKRFGPLKKTFGNDEVSRSMGVEESMKTQETNKLDFRQLGLLTKLTSHTGTELSDLSILSLLDGSHKSVKTPLDDSSSTSHLDSQSEEVLDDRNSSNDSSAKTVDSAPISTVVSECVQTAIFAAEHLCPSNHVFDGSICKNELVERVDMRCEDGYFPDEKSHSCVKETIADPQLRCGSEDYQLEYNQCVKVWKESPVSKCREGFDFDENEKICVKILKEPAKLTCTDVNAVFDGTSCEVRSAKSAIMECVNGTITNDVCVERDVIASVPTCLQGYSFDEELFRCVTVNVAPVSYTCPEDSVLVGENECEETKIVAPESTCPEWFIEKDGVCSREIMADKELLCSNDYTLIGTDCMAHIESPPLFECEAGFTLKGGVCVAVVESPPNAKCAQGYYEHSNKCIREITRPGIITCPPGYTYRSTKCFHEDMSPPIVTCPSGFMLDEAETECYAVASVAISNDESVYEGSEATDNILGKNGKSEAVPYAIPNATSNTALDFAQKDNNKRLLALSRKMHRSIF